MGSRNVTLELTVVQSSPQSLRITVAIATTGRASILCDTLPLMLEQRRKPDRMLVVAVHPADVAGVAELGLDVEVAYAERGLCHQRNTALELTRNDSDVIVFFDDDYIPSSEFLARLEQFFLQHADVAAVTGCVAIDGINHGGCEIDVARARIQEAEARLAQAPAGSEYHPSVFFDINHVYGCNMAARVRWAAEVRFDVRMPLYGWQEDRDFSRRLSAYGRIVRSRALWGAHLGVVQARSPGVRLGYSQVANPLYLLGKGTMQPVETALFVGRNLASNLVKSLRPEAWVDRRGRLRGNLLALSDAARGRIAPERILEL